MAPRISMTTEAIGTLHKAARQREHANVMQRLGDPLAAVHERIQAQHMEAAAMDALKMPEIAPTPPDGGEMAIFSYPDPADLYPGMHLRDTLRNPDMMSAQASLERYKLLLEIGCVELDQDLAATIQPTNSIERMLAGQLASVHYTALRLLAKSLGHTDNVVDLQSQWQREQNVEACRLANTAARLMASFQDGALTLQKLRTGGKQTVVVQHVQVQDGGQAVIAGDMTTGGGGLSATGGGTEKGGTTPCTQTPASPGTSTFKAPGAPPVVAPKPAKRRRASALPSEGNDAAASMGDAVSVVPEAISTP